MRLTSRTTRSPLLRSARGALAAAVLLSTAVATTWVAAVATAAPAGAQTQCGTTTGTVPGLVAEPTTLSAGATSTVTVRGTGYLTGKYDCTKSLFGGVYVFFGWVQPGGQWGPSWRGKVPADPAAGTFGQTYSYPGEDGGADTRDDGSGVVRLVSFTTGGMSGSETDFHMDANGNWTTTITVRGSLFQWKDPASGAVTTVDCRTVQCGIYSIGAHGKASATNELFVPINFQADGGPPPTVAVGGVSSGTPSSGGPSAGAGSSGPGGGPASNGGGSARGGGTAGGAPSGGSTGSSAGATETTVAQGAETTAAPETTAPVTATTEDEASDERDVVAGERASVQTFGDDGGSSSGIVIALAVVALLGAAGGAWFLLRRKRSNPTATPTA